MCRHVGFRWGGAGWWELTHGSGAHGGVRGEWLSGLCGLCCVFSLSVSLLFLFPLFAVLLNCPYPDPPVSACFFPFSSAPRRGEGRPRGAFVSSRSQTITTLNGVAMFACLFFTFQYFNFKIYLYMPISPYESCRIELFKPKMITFDFTHFTLQFIHIQ